MPCPAARLHHRQDGERREAEHDQEELQHLVVNRARQPAEKVYTSTIAADSSTEAVKLHPRTS